MRASSEVRRLAMVLIVTTLSSKEWLAIGVALAALVLMYGVAWMRKR